MPTLELEHISKQFPGVKALQDVSIRVEAGEIHAICGENGAGKSTLMNILSGNLQPNNGAIRIDGKTVKIENPQEAFAHNIAIVYQHLSLVENLSVAENIFANKHPVNHWGMIRSGVLRSQTSTLLSELGIQEINPGKLVAKLSPAEKQMVEIAKALSKNPSILILDEPTASLTGRETVKLFDILRTLKSKGVSILYISHRLEEIFNLADRVSILKDGKYQGTFAVEALTKDDLIGKMVGRELQKVKRTTAKSAEVLLAVKNVSGLKFTNVSFDLHRGEILGLAGLVGAGRSEIARAIFGIEMVHSGDVLFHQRNFRPKHPSTSIVEGMAYVTEDRKSDGLFPEMTVAENIVGAALPRIMTGGIYKKLTAIQVAAESKRKLHIAADVGQRVVNLSGGNQQKVMLAKWLLTEPDVLIVDEPTHGIDVGAKYEIYEILQSLAQQGKGILIISSELTELIALCDKVIVIKNGCVAGEFDAGSITEENIIRMAT